MYMGDQTFYALLALAFYTIRLYYTSRVLPDLQPNPRFLSTGIMQCTLPDFDSTLSTHS
jgi:hypothetical protein